MVADNQRLVGHLYKRALRACAVPLDPIEQELLWDCMQNRLIRAVQSYDPDTGNAFSTFAYACIWWTGWQDYRRECRDRVWSLSLDRDLPDASGDTALVFAPGSEDDLDADLDFQARLVWLRTIIGERRTGLLVRNIVYGESYAEIARDLGYSKEGIRRLILEALAIVRREVERKGVAV